MFIPTLRHGLCFVLCLASLHADPLETQPSTLAPKKSDKGVLFQFEAPDAAEVHLAGTFNNWLSNQEGRITDKSGLMVRDAGKDIWSTTVKLPPGRHRFKFVVVDTSSNEHWLVPDFIEEKDDDGNGILWVSSNGAVSMSGGPKGGLKPVVKKDGDVTFQFWSPQAGIVYLAGDFNNWADNQDGKVLQNAAAMEGPDADGVWRKTVPLRAGVHHYQFVIDGDTWVRDPNEEDREGDHSLLTTQD
jgi:1,4-alpha-glucan branching enzyme